MGECIVAAAIQYRVGEGQIVVSAPIPGRHHTIITGLFLLTNHTTRAEDEQGFLTSEGRFVDRETACRIAREAGQIKTKHGPADTLFSEDMW